MHRPADQGASMCADFVRLEQPTTEHCFLKTRVAEFTIDGPRNRQEGHGRWIARNA